MEDEIQTLQEKLNTSLAGFEKAERDVDAAARTGVMLTSAVALAATVAVLLVAFFVANSITRPILTVTDVARKLASGDVNQTVEIQSRDEIGVLANAFRQIIAYQQTMATSADNLAQGDVSVDVTPQSEQDVLGNASAQSLSEMAATLQALVPDRLVITFRR